MNEINALIWPNPRGIGLPPPGSVAQTMKIAKTYGVIKQVPKGATNYAYAAKALAQLKASGANVTGATWKKVTVKVTVGGK
jgi:hypothetical protein